jgi:replicative DNA helicase
VATNVAKGNHPVLFISPEMTELQLAQRMLSAESGVAYKKISKPSRMTESERISVREAYESTRTLPLVIDDSPDQTINDIRLKARRMEAKSGLDLIVVDYLQLLCEGDDTKEAITIVSKGLKAIAKTINIPVLAVSQLSRAMTYQNRKRPELTDLRGSGQLEQDADSVLFLWHPTGAKDRIEVFIDKNRNGPLGAEEFYFEQDTTKFKKGAW